MKVDWLIVGAGLTGATFAERIANERGESVLILDQRDHIAGNAWDEYNSFGILEHKYGPHIFHTNSKQVWDYLSQFTEWRPYFHKVLGSIDGKLVPLPFNLNSIDQLFPSSMAERIISKLVNVYGYGSRVPILELLKASDEDLRFIADYAYKNVFEQYTLKQWGMRPEDLSPAVTSRVPILVSRDDRYFQDTFQAMPLLGFGVMVRRMLSHPKIRIMLKTRWQDIQDQIIFDRMVFTGPIDEFFQFKHGKLPYRSLKFQVDTFPFELSQSAAVINYPNEYDYTRITEMKWLTGQRHSQTTTFTEFPIPHVHGQTVPYYPIPTEDNKQLFKLYQEESDALQGKVIFAGRLGDYMYYNMDQAVARALMLFSKMNKNG
ncbi:MAG: UDP-galactopyranose mutase [Algoriphagus aquaeductus]|uniref:UDP-galactopyranose mutase n=1 Tax=Algoriphagus aquaeductus TaxID=475299 RepID=UPI00387A0887